MTPQQNKRGPKTGTSSFIELSLEEILELLATSPSKKVPVRRKWVEESAAAKFVARKSFEPQEGNGEQETVAEPPNSENQIVVEEID